MTDINELAAQVSKLADALQQLQRPVHNDADYSKLYRDGTVKLKPFSKASAELKKAAHNYARQFQRKLDKKDPNYTVVYKEAFNCHMESNGYKGKYRNV
jgi:outer membrane murein-binding lipoprotein Lpp